ncbi:PGF-CTERM sorting domain-containing protein [Haloglomus salinum]|uniref:PGF-CTERM sorting domain-containing protein n=1 Tax=Haloglomus salinum TaxID=2962673 RepID=UPI0020CA2522|nr:PGF-CTERM sorting domain-containing protein [Haloglomus salinum]
MDDATPSAGYWRRVVVALVALLMVSSMAIGAGAGAAVAAADDPAQQSLQEDDDSTGNQTLDVADEIYVKENGDAILYYEDETEQETGTESELTNGEYGLHVGQGIFYGLIVSDLEETPNATGSAQAVLEPGALTAEGELTTVRPQAIEDLSLTVDAVRTQENNRFDADGRVAVATRSAPSLRLVESADTSLEATVAPNSFDATGSLNAQTSTQLGQPMSGSFELVEGEGTYTLEAAQNQTIREFSKDQWDTEERARQTIRQRYASVAEQLGGSATVTLNSYAFANASQRGVYRLDVDYTVEYEGVDEGLERQAAAYLANSEQFNLSREAASGIAANVTQLEIERIAADFRMQAQSVEGSFDFQLENYNDALLAGLDAAAAYSPPEQEVPPVQPDQLETLRAQIEAQQAADLTRTYSLSASHTLESSSLAVIELQAQSRTENWGAYVSELQSRDIPVANQEFSLAADTSGDQIVANGSLSVEQEDLVDTAVDQFLNATETQNATDEDVEQARQFVRAFREAGFQKARTDVSVSEGNVTFEAGAKFEDMAAFRDVLQQSGRLDLSVSQVVGRSNESGSLNQYVYVTGAVEAGAGESAVRELSVVDEDTTVNMPGSYDRSFPEMETERAYDYLGLEAPTPTPTAGGGDGGDGGDGGTSSDGQPGFGAVAALVALVAAALLARRQH